MKRSLWDRSARGGWNDRKENGRFQREFEALSLKPSILTSSMFCRSQCFNVPQKCAISEAPFCVPALVCRSVAELLSPVAPPGSAAQPFSPFWFTVEPQDTLVFRGNSALLNCSAHSDAATPARVEWKKDGTFMSLVSDERRRILPDGSLLFTHVVHSKHNKPDEGTYQCVATIENLGSISSRTARLWVAGERG